MPNTKLEQSTIPYPRFREVTQKNKELKLRITEFEKENIELKAQISILEQIILKSKKATE